MGLPPDGRPSLTRATRFIVVRDLSDVSNRERKRPAAVAVTGLEVEREALGPPVKENSHDSD
ncbi:MAG: hypothetical protein V2I43_00985 [Parvularcula sp.]|jgi:hypothetical protein|nr:hypothetical protein [Parvularcula sp.]